MCEYCEKQHYLAFTKKENFSICVVDDELYINDEQFKNVDYLNINYCPMCGRKLVK